MYKKGTKNLDRFNKFYHLKRPFSRCFDANLKIFLEMPKNNCAEVLIFCVSVILFYMSVKATGDVSRLDWKLSKEEEFSND